MSVLSGLEPKKVFEYFEAVSQIPRASKDEKRISDYCKHKAESLGFKTQQDAVHNLVVYVPASPSYEHCAPVALQGHLDMVCEKNLDSTHDFSKDPLSLYLDGDFIRARGTTLGADNGIAVALMLAIMDSPEISHPALELLFTSDEEAGMGGAIHLNPDWIRAKRLINLDSGGVGDFVAGCAGGANVVVSLPIEKEEGAFSQPFIIRVTGLMGGHSGLDIIHGRGNANKILARVLTDLFEKIDFELSDIGGGEKDNAIPREAYALIRTNEKEKLKEELHNMEKVLQNEYRVQDPKLTIICQEKQQSEQVLTKKSTEKLLALLTLLPNGVWNMSQEMKNLVETSNNLASIRLHSSAIICRNAVRSSVASRKEEILHYFHTLSNTLQAKCVIENSYPGWQYEPHSKLLKDAISIYEEKGEKANILAIHAGLECGIFREKFVSCDMIAIGPDITDYHTPMERLSISSVQAIWAYLQKLLASFKN